MDQLELQMRPPTRGGSRPGAGRPPRVGRRANVRHRRRAVHSRHHPVHVTMRVRGLLPSLREQSLGHHVMRQIAQANASEKLKDVFRVVHFSVQDDHLHLIVEAADGVSLSRGAQGLAIRVARCVNRLLGIRGVFWGDRFHARDLTSPRAVRNAIVYVLMNAKKHGQLADDGIDPLSSACEASLVRRAETWLGALGWRRYGLIRTNERPRVMGSSRAGP